MINEKKRFCFGSFVPLQESTPPICGSGWVSRNADHWSRRIRASYGVLVHNNGVMPKTKRKRAPRTVLRLPDLEQSKSAVLNSLASQSSQRSYDHAIREFTDWYCSEPRLAFNKTVVTRSDLPRAGPLRVVDHQPSARRRSPPRV